MTPYLAVQHGEAAFIVPTEEDSTKLFVHIARRSEFICLERAVSILRDAGRLEESGTIVDVGAHIGTTTIAALKQHGFSRAVAIEPDPDNLRLLRANVALNGLHDNVTVVAAALSDAPVPQFFVPGRERGGWAKGALLDEPSANANAVETTTLDGLADAGIVDPAATSLLWLGRRLETDAPLSATAFLEHRVPIVMPFRRRRFTDASAFLRQVEPVYERVVDLRRPNLDEPLSAWTPVVVPIDRLLDLAGSKHTDVVIF